MNRTSSEADRCGHAPRPSSHTAEATLIGVKHGATTVLSANPVEALRQRNVPISGPGSYSSLSSFRPFSERIFSTQPSSPGQSSK
jgi:hypothetical protein